MRQYTSQTRQIPGPAGAVRSLLLQPRTPAGKAPGILWLHGGGYLTGFPEMVHFSRAAPLVSKFGAVVLAPAYRLSGRHPYPAALEDAAAALRWLAANAAALGVDPSLLIVGGESAGGGLAAALCLCMRDTGGVPVSMQLPLYPMLDPRETATSRDNPDRVWNSRCNKAAWKKYLRGIEGPCPSWAAPALSADLSGLPPCYTFVSRGEPFEAETVRYVENLRRAGVPAEMDIWDGPHHAFDMLRPGLAVSREAAARFEEQFAEMLARAAAD